MEDWSGARWVGPADGRQVLLLNISRIPGGMIRYAYSVYPGAIASLLVGRGTKLPAPDDPAIVAEVIRLEDAYRDRLAPERGTSETPQLSNP